MGTSPAYSDSHRIGVVDYHYHVETGGISKLYERELHSSLVLKSTQMFERRRDSQIQYVIQGSAYLTELDRIDHKKAYYKALQAIRREPQKDKPGLLAASEKAALVDVRKNLVAIYWRLYRQEPVEAVISQRLRGSELHLISQSLRANLGQQLIANQWIKNARTIRNFRKRIARLPHRSAEQAAAVLMLLFWYASKLEGCDIAGLCEAVAYSYESQLPLTFAYFVCLDATSHKAFSANPAEYMPTHYTSRRVRRQSALLMELLSDLEVLRAPYELQVFLADTDALEYVFPFVTETFSKSEYWNRVESHCADVIRQLAWLSNYRYTVERWSTFEMRGAEETRPPQKDDVLWSAIAKTLDPDDIDGEAAVLAQEFLLVNSGADAVGPSPDFKRMAQLKILMYAMQGYLLQTLSPVTAPILIQSEFPDPRRRRMYQALLRDKIPRLAIISPWIKTEHFSLKNKPQILLPEEYILPVGSLGEVSHKG